MIPISDVLQSSDERRNKVPSCDWTRRVVALARHFYAFPSRFTTQLAAELFPKWNTAETSYVCAHVCL